MIFGNIKHETLIQEKDKTRIDVSGSFITPDEAAVTLTRVQPSGTDSFYTVSNYLDWAYLTAGVYTITLEITTDGIPQLFTSDVLVESEADDALLSKDSELLPIEDDILNYVRKGRNSFIDKHREAQRIILDDLDKSKIWKEDGARFVATDLIDKQEFKEWSKYLVLHLIFKSLSNAIDDIFSQKAKRYLSFSQDNAQRGKILLDTNGDGEAEAFYTTSAKLVRQ